MVPKVLIVANTAFHMSNNNGRTLGMLLKDLPNENKRLLCLIGDSLSSRLIEDGYRISDGYAVKHLLSRRLPAEKLPVDLPPSGTSPTANRRIPKTALTMLLRDLVWSLVLKRTDFLPLAKAFAPDVVLWQLGDSPFMARLALLAARQSGAKLFVFTTEDYYFKTWDYFARKESGFFYKIFSRRMRKAVRALFSETALCIANTPQLAQRYRAEFGVETAVLMCSAQGSLEPEAVSEDARQRRVVYAGNLDFDRHLALIELARALYEVEPSVTLELYGRAEEKIMTRLEREPNIRLMGFVPYESLAEILRTSLLVLHAESRDAYFRRDLKAAFSTKIADSLCCATPLFLYAPEELILTRYLAEGDGAFVCTDPERLQDSLREALQDRDRRAQVLRSALALARENHDPEKNSRKMLALLNG